MRSFYVDASALAKRYTYEAGTPLLNHLFGSAYPSRMYVLGVGIAEVASVLVRKKNAGVAPAAATAQALLSLGADFLSATVPGEVVADHLLVASAVPLIETHSINGTDALVLRSALDLAAWLRRAGDDLVLVASDQRLLW